MLQEWICYVHRTCICIFNQEKDGGNALGNVDFWKHCKDQVLLVCLLT